MELNYQIDGPNDAPVVVLSNSLGTTLAMWTPQLAALSAQYRVLRYDTHGHGATRKTGPTDLARLGQDAVFQQAGAAVAQADVADADTFIGAEDARVTGRGGGKCGRGKAAAGDLRHRSGFSCYRVEIILTIS